MGSTDQAETIFSLALQIERDLAEFYKVATQSVQNDQVLRVCIRLSEMEAEHVDNFLKMRSDLISSIGRLDEIGKASPYLSAVLGGKIKPFSVPFHRRISTGEREEEIIQLAIDIERETILFYLSLLPLVTNESANHIIHQIIQEEMGHIAILAEIPIF